MAYDVQTLKADLEGVLHGTTLNQITNLDGLIDRAARKVLLDIDPQETLREVPFTSPVFDQVYEYPLAEDVKGISIVDIKPQVNRNGQIFNQDYSQQFSLSEYLSWRNQFNIKFNTSVKTIQINAPFVTPPIIVNSASSTTVNGTWVGGGDVTDLENDYQNYIAGGGSLLFNLSGVGTTGYLENSTMDSVDLTEHENLATEFLWTFLQTGTAVTSIELRWGSSSTNYWSRSMSVNQADNAFNNGWNLMDFIWDGATQTGSPDVTEITYLRVTWTYNGDPQTGLRLNYVTSQLGSIFNYVYYSKFLFRNLLTGAYQENVLDDSDLINLDTESYNILTYQVAYLASQQQQGRNALQYDGKFFLDQYDQAVAKYKARYKSQLQKPAQNYYAIKKGGYGGWASAWWGWGGR